MAFKMYILPSSNGESNTVPDLLKKAGVTYLEIEALHELWQYMGQPTPIVVRVPDHVLVILVRHMGTLLGEEPTRIDAAPGSRYTYQWTTSTSTLPSELWDTLSGKFAKSGLLAHSPDQVEERSDVSPQGHKTEASRVAQRSKAKAAIDAGFKPKDTPSSDIDLDDLETDFDESSVGE